MLLASGARCTGLDVTLSFHALTSFPITDATEVMHRAHRSDRKAQVTRNSQRGRYPPALTLLVVFMSHLLSIDDATSLPRAAHRAVCNGPTLFVSPPALMCRVAI